MSLRRRNARHSNVEVRIELPPSTSARVYLGGGPTQTAIDTMEAEVNAWAVADESLLVTCHGSMTNPLPSARGSIRFWNLHTGQLVTQFSFKGGAISDVNVSADDHLLATANTDGTISVYRIRDLLSR
jgi:WD40 repeat protein